MVWTGSSSLIKSMKTPGKTPPKIVIKIPKTNITSRFLVFAKTKIVINLKNSNKNKINAKYQEKHKDEWYQ